MNDFFNELGLKGVNLYINSIGCRNCRRTYNDVLLDFLNKHENELWHMQGKNGKEPAASWTARFHMP